MKCDNCGSAEAEVEFDAKTEDGATLYESHNLCYDCLNQIITSIDTMGLVCIKRDKAETEEDNNDNDT